MEYQRLPDISCPVSRLGLGGCPLGGHGWGAVDEAELLAAVRSAQDLGINFFDTADIYGLGHSEELLSTALGESRHKMIIASKFGVRRSADGKSFFDNSPAYLEQALTASLKRLRMEQIPLYYLHWPDGKTPIQESVAAMRRCQERGLIGAIGLSNVAPSDLAKACQIATIAAVQVQYSLVDRQQAAQLAVVAARNAVPLITWGSLAQGLLTGKFDASTRFESSDRRSRYENFTGEKFVRNLQTADRVKGVAERLGCTPGQVAIRWLLDTPGVGSVLFGAKTPQQVIDNVGAAGWRLAAEDYEWLEVGEDSLLAAA